jgi:SAM-dependent methyltransferase
MSPVVSRRGNPGRVAREAANAVAAVLYAVAYEAVVDGFRPYEVLVDEIATRIEGASRPLGAPVRVLDAACGTGMLATRLAARGHEVVGVDPVERLVRVARARHGAVPRGPTFFTADIAVEPVPAPGSFDAVISPHTLYWHGDPDRHLAGCRAALRPGGVAAVLTYTEPVHPARLWRRIAREVGLARACASLRWTVPTALFEGVRHVERRYLSPAALRAVIEAAGFEVVSMGRAFLGGISLLALARVDG